MTVEDDLNVDVVVLDENDHSPEFLNQGDPLILSVDANTRIGERIAKLEVRFYDALSTSMGLLRRHELLSLH